MSKSKLKSILMSMDRERIIKLVLELYSARKEAQEYLDFYTEPDEYSKLNEYKHIIKEEFYPSRNSEPKTRFSVCRKAVSDFKKLKPSANTLADLMVFYMETVCRFTYDYGDMWEQFYISVEGNFNKTLNHLVLTNLWDKYDLRIRQCLRWADSSGWGFSDALNEMYEEHRKQNEELKKSLNSNK